MKIWPDFFDQTIRENFFAASILLSALIFFNALIFSPVAMAGDSSFHPADRDKNKIIDQEELDSYVRLWQEEDAPFIYAIRALYLVHSGGAYAWDQSQVAPECWYPFPEGQAQIQLFGPEEVVVECAESFDDPGVEAQDTDGSVLTVTPTVTLDGLPVDSVNTGFSGSGRTFQITYTAEAQTGPISVTRQVLVEDTQAPIIEPTFLQFDPVSVRPYGYRDFDVDWNYYPESFYVHDVNCNANWQMIDSGTAWDTCGEGTPTDYWDDVEVTVRPLVGNYIPEQDDEGNDIFVPVEEFTQHPGRYRLDYTVRDAAGNESTYTSDPYFRYVRVMDTTPVPVVALSGYTREEAEERVSAAHLIPVVTEEYHAWINAGAIFSQDPAAGVFVSCGTEVHFSISLGPGDCIFPEIFGMQIEDAKAALIDAGFVVGNVNYEDSDATAGTVLDYQGNTLVCGAIIDLTVAAEKCVMPAIDTGASPDDAIAQIVDAGFAEPEVIFEWHTYPANTLFGQFPVPGEQLCNTPSKIYFSLGLIPVEIILSAVWENNIECNTVWVDPGAIVSAGSDIVEPVAIIQAAEIAYKDGDDWIAVASDTPLHTDFSPYRITYRYEYQQPDTEELGVLETEYLLNVTDMEYPEVTVDESPDSFKEINDIDYPYYLFAKGQYGHWNEVEQDRGITVSAWDLCDGDIPQDNIDLLILYLDADLDENTDKGEYDDDDSLPVMSLEELGLTEDTWLSAPGIYIVVYIAVDEAKNDAGSIRLVQVADPAEAI